MIPGICAAPMLGGMLPKITFIGSVLDAADKTSSPYTYTTTVDVGVITGPTLLVMGCGAWDGNIRTVTGGTIGGSAASLAVAGVANNTCSALLYREVNSGGSTAFTFSPNDVVRRGFFNIWKIEDYLSSTPVGTNTQNTAGATSLTGAVNVSAGGVIIGTAIANSTGTVTWTGVTERHDEDLESLNRVSGGDDQLFSDVTGYNVVVNFGSSRRGQLCCASWR